MKRSMGLSMLVAALLLVGATTRSTLAQSDEPTAGAAPAGVAQQPEPACDAGRPGTVGCCELVPAFDSATLVWLGLVVLLVLLVQKRLLGGRNIDLFVLAVTILLLAWRHTQATWMFDRTGHSVAWWSNVLLTAAGVYWLLRGLCLLTSSKLAAFEINLNGRALAVVVVAGLLIAGHLITHAPLSAGARDGLTGGICFDATGKLPYGDAPGYEARSPLLYMLFGTAVKAVPPTYQPQHSDVAMAWEDKDTWLKESSWDQVDPRPVWLVNGLLLVLLVLAVWIIGTRLHSRPMAAVLIGALCFFPGAAECFARPEVMLPTVLVAWALALSLLPAGALLAMILLALAGAAWPWAWLLILPALGYHLRRGWAGLGALVGLAAGVVLVVAGAAAYVNPTLPRAAGAWADPASAPPYVARTRDDGTIVIEPNPDRDAAAAPTPKGRFWNFLLARDNVTLADTTLPLALPNGVDAATVRYREILPLDEATRDVLRADYREAAARRRPVERAWVAVRSLVEETWKPQIARELPEPSSWECWATTCPQGGERWTLIRRIAKLVALLLSLVTGFLLIRGRKPEPYHLVGATLAMLAITLVVSYNGAITNWVWVMPGLLAGYAARGAASAAAAPTATPAPPPVPDPLEPAPRITVEE